MKWAHTLIYSYAYKFVLNIYLGWALSILKGVHNLSVIANRVIRPLINSQSDCMTTHVSTWYPFTHSLTFAVFWNTKDACTVALKDHGFHKRPLQSSPKVVLLRNVEHKAMCGFLKTEDDCMCMWRWFRLNRSFGCNEDRKQFLVPIDSGKR